MKGHVMPFWSAKRFPYRLRDMVSWRHWRYVFRSRLWGYVRRARRGWADVDVWSLDTYLAGVMAGSLARLAKIKRGCPTEFLPESGTRELAGGEYTVAEVDAACEAWLEWLRAMSKDFAGYAERGLDPDAYAQYDARVDKLRRVFDHWGDLWD